MTSSGIGYLEYLPDGYKSNSNKYPVVISLHGIKEKGNTLSDVGKVANVGLPKYVKYGTKYSFILISPQLKTTMGRWTGDYIMKVLAHVKSTLRVDESRIYLTGLSLGGGGVWSVATAYPNVFASILPICSGYNVSSSACKIAGANLPVWTFHGDKDYVVSHNVSVSMINAINNCSPKCNPQSKITIYPGMGHVIWDKVYKDSGALNWMLSFRKGSTSGGVTTPSNNAPVANAGSDKTLTLPSNATTIYGSGSDSDGSIASYSWSKKSGGSVSMTGTTSKDLKLSNLVAGTYVFTLSVKDNDGATDTDDVSVIVKSSTTTTNTAPVANAGTDRTLTLPSNSTTLFGSASDKEGSIASYSWSKKSGGSATMSGTTTKDLRLSNLVAGTYVFTLTVKDSKGAVDTDDAMVVVKSSTTSSTSGAPIANAGTDRSLTWPANSTALFGSGSDAGGSIVAYNWNKKSGGSVTMTGTTSKDLRLSNLLPGTYVFTLTVKDNSGQTDSDDVTVVVKSSTTASTGDDPTGSASGTSSAPVANAGTDRLLTLPDRTTTLYGSGKDSDGRIVSYLWTKKSGGAATMSGTTSSQLKLTNLVAGTYYFALTVKDNSGRTDSDDVKVVVKSSTTASVNNAAPNANAGSDKIVYLPTNAIALKGSGTDRDGSITAYNWKKVSGKNASLVGTSQSMLRVSSLLEGSYVFRLTVKDNDGATASDDVNVIVDRAPIVNAGADKTITLPRESLILTGSATDNGSISSFLWSKYSGPNLSMSNTRSKSVKLSNFHEGTYVIKLAVKDNYGLTGYDYVKVRVEDATASVESLSNINSMLATLEANTNNNAFID